MSHPKAPKALPSVEVISQYLDYFPETGVFVWKVDKFPARKGEVAGTLNRRHGYRIITINGRMCRASRLAWKVHYGEDPADLVDHINGDRSNNSIGNLRVVSEAQNHLNIGVRINSSTGVTGVTWCNTKRRWVARITRDKKVKAIGSFLEFEEAVNARRYAEKLVFGEFARAA